MVKQATIFPILFFLSISAVLIFCWFRFGYIYGGGDTGLPLYNPQTMANIASNIWWDSLAPGIPVAQGLTSAPMLYLLSIPQALGASPVFIQAFLFFILLFLMGYGMYLLALNIFGKGNYLLAVSAGVFYLFNPYMMIQIWHRFIHNSMFFVAFLPFLVMTWLWWIRKRSPRYLLLFLGVNFLAVYIYGTIAFIVAVWTLLFLLTLLEALIPWKGRKVALGLAVTFFIGLVFWLLTNSWWFIPTFSVSTALFVQQHTTDDSLSTLTSLSAQTILPYTLRLINPFYLYWHADWGSIYQNVLFVLISWLFVLVTFVGFVRGLRQKAYAVWSLLLLIVIFLAKGVAPPFSFPYIFSFSHFFPLGVIRNPFEKLGILLPFVYAILFSLGLQFLIITSIKYIGKSKTYLLLIIFILLHMAFFWPMFAGKLFGTLDKPAFVEVPKAYTQANEWIKQDLGNSASEEGRILHLPLPRSEDVTYNWEHGYSGVEPSAAIFTALPSIARGLDISKVNDVLSGLSLIFHKPYSSNHAAMLKMLQDFSIKYIILHKDIQWLGGELYNTLETETVLDKLEFLDRKVAFGGLTIYRLKDSYFRPKVIISSNIELLKPSKKNLFWPWLISTPSTEMVTSLSNEQDSSILNKVRGILISPNVNISAKNFTVFEFEGNLDNFNNVRVLPDSPFYFLVELKERLSLISKSETEKQRMEVVFAEKRLVEMYKIKRMEESEIISKDKGNRIINSEIERYKKTILEIFNNELISNTVFINGYQTKTLDVFQRHVGLLNEVKKSLSNKDSKKKLIDDTIAVLTKSLVDKGLIQEYQLEDINNLTQQDKQLYIFNAPLKSNYEVLLSRPETKNIYPNDLFQLDFQIDNEINKLTKKNEKALMSFGEIKIDSGKHSMNILELSSVNLISNYSDMIKVGHVNISDSGIIEIFSGKQDTAYIEGDIKSAYGGDTYIINFDFQVLSGPGIRIQISQDTDQSGSLDQSHLGYNNYYFPGSSKSNQWRRFEGGVNLRTTTQKARLRIQAEPWDACWLVVSDKKSCLDQKVKQQYNQSSKFLLKNIKVSRGLNNNIFLRASLPVNPSSTASGTILEVNKQNPSFYWGKVEIIEPTFIFFKESFDPGWELTLYKDKEIYKPSQHLLANLFANAWFVEKKGDYDFVVSYNPQKFIKVGMLFAGLGLVIALILVVGYNFRRLTPKI